MKTIRTILKSIWPWRNNAMIGCMLLLCAAASGQGYFLGFIPSPNDAMSTTFHLQPGEYFSETYTVGTPSATWSPY